MIDDNKRRKIYDALSNDYDMPSYEQFSQDMADEGKRRKMYDAMAQDYDMPSFEVFTQDVTDTQQQPQQPTAQPQSTTYNHATFAPMQRSWKESAMPEDVRQRFEQQEQWKRADEHANFQKEMDAKVKSMQQSLEGMGDRMSKTIQSNRPLAGDPTRPFGKQEDLLAPARQARIYEEGKQAEKRLKEELPGQIETRLGDIETMLVGARDRATEQFVHQDDIQTLTDKDASFGKRLGAAFRFNSMYNSSPTGAAMVASKLYTPEVAALTAAKRKLQSAQNTIEEAQKHADDPAWLAEFGRGLKHGLTDISTWDFGVTDLLDASAIQEALEKYDKNEELTAAEQAMLDAVATEVIVNEYFGSDVSNWYKGGNSTAVSIPFMASMIVSPAMAAGRSASAAMARYITKRFASQAAKKGVQKVASKVAEGTLKATSRVVTDATAAALHTATFSPLQIEADTKERMRGQIVPTFDSDGKVKYGGHVLGDSEGVARRKASLNAFIENMSEMMGDWIPGAKVIFGNAKWAKKLLKNKFVGGVANIERRAQFHGFLGEGLEEIVGGIMNAGMVGDQTLDADPETGVFSKDNLGTIAISIGATSIAFGCAKLGAYGASKRQLHKTDKQGAQVFGDQWADIKSRLESDKMADVEAAANEIAKSDQYSPEQKTVAAAYASLYTGINAYKYADQKDVDLDAKNANDTFESAYNDATSDMLRSDIYNMMKDSRDAVRQTLGEDILRMMEDEDPLTVKQTLEETQQLTVEQAAALAKYVAAHSAMSGVLQRIEDDADAIANEQQEEAKKRQYKDGSIHPATLKELDADGNPKEVFVVDGDVTIDDEGNISGGENIVVYDPLEGKNRFLSPSEIAELGEVTTSEQQEQNIEANKQDYIQQQMDAATGRFNPQPGQLIDMPDGGQAMVLAVDGETVTLQMPDDTQQTMSIADIQKIADGVAMEDYRQRHPEATAAPEQPMAEHPKGSPQAFEPMMELTIRDDDGNEQQVVVTGGRARFTGKGYADDPNGKFVELYVAGSEEPRYILEDELKKMVTDYKEAEQPAAEVETPTEEQVEAPVAEQTEEQPQEEPATVSPEVTIYNNVKGEYPEAYRDKVENTVKIKAKRMDDAKKALDKANADLTATEYGSKEESTAKAKRDKAQQAYDAAVADHEQWKAIKSLKDQEMLAEQEAKDAEMKAKAEQRRAEIEAARKRDQEAYEAEMARRKAEKEKKIEASLNSMMQMREDSEPMEQMAKEWPIEDDAEAMEIMNDRSPRTLEEVAAWMLSDTKDTKNKIDPELIREHTGYGTADFKKFPFIFKKGGMSPEAFGEKIEQTARENDVVFDENDTNIGFKALLNVLGEVGGLGDLKNYIKNNRIAEAEKLHSDRLREAVARKVEDDWIAQHGGMTREEYASYINWMEDAVEQRKTALTDEEYNQLFNTDYDTRTATTNEGSIERGAEKSGADETEAGQTGVAADVTRRDGEAAGREGAAEVTAWTEGTDTPLESLAEVKKFMETIGYKGSLSKVLTDNNGRKFVKYYASGNITPNIYLGETTPFDIWQQFNLYGNNMGVNIPADIKAELDHINEDARGAREALWAEDREQVKNLLTEAGIPFYDVTDSERGSRIVFTDRKNDNGNYVDYMDVADVDQAREDINFIRVKAERVKELQAEAIADAQPLSLADIAEATDRAQGKRTTKKEKKPTQKKEKTTEQPQEGDTYGADNTIVTRDRYEELKERMRKKMLGQLNAGIDPEILAIGTEMAAYHIEAGARKFADFAKRMIADLGDAIRPYLKAFYNGVRDMPEMADLEKEMTPYDEVRKVDVENFDKEGQPKDLIKTAQTIAKEHDVEKEVEEATTKLKKQRKDNKTQQTTLFDTEEEQQREESQGVTAEQKAFSNAVANDMITALATGEKPYRSIADLRKRAQSVGMTVDTDGRDDILLQELVEDGLVKAAREVIESGKYGGRKSRTAYEAICNLYDLQPTIAQRSSNRIKMQQYSTPLPMAFVSDMFAWKPGTNIVLEPTAGNGMLVFAIPANDVVVNELDKTRLANLRGQGFLDVKNLDALTADFGGTYDAVIANPPFGKADAKEYDGKSIAGLDEQITLNALSAMKDDGRAAIIIGGNMEYGKNGAITNNRAFWTYLYDHYNVKGVVDMEGKLYAKQGTTYPTRMILIDGRRSDEERTQTKVYPPVKDKAVRKAETFEDLYDIVNEINNSIQKTNGTEVLRSGADMADAIGQTRNTPVHRSAVEHNENAADERRNGRRERAGSTKRNAGSGVRQTESEGGSGVRRPADTGLSGENKPLSRNADRTATETSGDTVRSAGRNGLAGLQNVADGQGQRNGLEQTIKEKKARALDIEKLPYRPHNSAFKLESVAPAAMVEAMDNTLSEIEKTYGQSIDEFVTEQLGYDSIDEMHNALAAEQVDSVAMALHQMSQGNALIIGDQTGVGKGRQMAALIRWACKQGKKPIFITQKADLFSDIYRDLVDIGSGDLRPFIFNSDGAIVDSNGNVVYKPMPSKQQAAVFASGELPEGYDFAVLTYSQVNTGDAISQEQSRNDAKSSGRRGGKVSKAVKDGKKTPKATFLRNIAKDNYLFLDESHTAAGDSNVGAYIRSIIGSKADAAMNPNGGAKAVTFASATFAKRPDTMPMYALRTAMSEANIEQGDLIGIIEKGGVTLQEIMSRALTESGQMVRRERDMSDVRTDWETVSDAATVKRARENYDKTIEAFNAIIRFQEMYVKPMIEQLSADLANIQSSANVKKGTDKMGVENVPFASKTYNYTKQLMLALKADAIVDRVAQEIEAGRHPVIALESTMEASLKDYAIDEVIEEPTFSASLLRGLDTVMQYTVKDEDGNESHMRYQPSALGVEGERAYYELQNFIREATKDVFISPLDAIIEKLHERGYKVGELTGRNTYAERDSDGNVVVKRRTDKDKKRMQREFNNGTLDVLILNKSASTGISLHASKNFEDQRQRSMIIAQPLSDINDYMQMIGRIDRTGQVHRGYYINLGLPVPAESRFLMMLSTKLKSLNANTTTSQESESNSVDAPDLLNKYGSQVVVEYLRDNPDIYIKMGDPLKLNDSDKSIEEQLEEYKPSKDDTVARKITGYVALLSTAEQEAFYNDVVQRYTDLIKYLDSTGTNDLKITVMPLKAKTLKKKVSSKGKDPNGNNPFAGNAYVEEVEMDVLRKPMKAEEVRKTIEQLNKPTGSEKGHLASASKEKAVGERVLEIVGQVQGEADVKIQAENKRYEAAKVKADADMAKYAEKINGQQRTAEEKADAIARYTEETNEKVEKRHTENVNVIKARASKLVQSLQDFTVGSTYLLPQSTADAEQQQMFRTPAIFCGFKVKKNGITPSTSFAVFATLDGRRRVEVKFTDNTAIEGIRFVTNSNWNEAQSITLDNWDSQIPTDTRKKGYIMTGNILQAVADTQDEFGNYPGQLISYSDIDGNIHDGILMPDQWNPGLLRTSGVPIIAKLADIKKFEPVTSQDGKVEITGSEWSGEYYLTVPKSKKDGAAYFDNEKLLSLIHSNGFYPYRGNLRADILQNDIEKVVRELDRLGVRVKGEDDADIRFRSLDPESDNVVDNAEVGTRPLSDREKVAKLEAEPKVKVYRSMQLIDGKLYPPMSAKVDGKLREPSELGVWEEADEAPELADENGKFKLDKGNKKSLKAAYNPYIHTSRTMLNDQFSEAQSRPNLVVVEMEVPESELTSGYKAEKAKDSVGAKQWKAGVIQGQLSGTREVILSRWAKPVRIVPNSEVAANIAEQIDGQVAVMPSNVVTPSVRAELEKLGVQFVETDNTGKLVDGPNKGKTWASVYGKKASDALMREGDRMARKEVSYDEALASAKAAGYTKKQFDAMLERRRRNVKNAKEALADTLEKLHLSDKITFVESVDEVEGLTDEQREQRRDKKGWYLPKSDKIVIVLGNHRDQSDVLKTILHEGVAHHGLRAMFGKAFDDFLDNVYAAAEYPIREQIAKLAKYHGWNIRTATEEYLAGLAEDTNFEDVENSPFAGWWTKIKQFFFDMLSKLGIKDAFKNTYAVFSDNELRYILWRSYQNLVNPGRYRSFVDKANDVVMQDKLKVGNYEETSGERGAWYEPAKAAEPGIDLNEVATIEAEPETDGFVSGLGIRMKMTDGNTYQLWVQTGEDDGMRGVTEFYGNIDEDIPNEETTARFGKLFGEDVNTIFGTRIGNLLMSPRTQRNGITLSRDDIKQYDKAAEPSAVADGADYERRDREYADAVENGDKDKVKKLITEAADEAMPNSKVRDKKGNLRVMYHGTVSDNQFTKFDGDIYMFAKPNLADQYTHKRRALSVDPKQSGRIMPVFVNLENPLEVDAKRHLWRNIDVEWSDKPVSTEDIVKYAKENGYDGVIIKNVRDNMFDNDTSYSDEVIAFDSSQVKSTGPTYEQTRRSNFPWDTYDEMKEVYGATYDDNGDMIPLSERFNNDNDDIRFREGDVPRVQAREAYERSMGYGANQFKEAVQDSMLSLKELYRAILGKDAKIEDVKGYENAYLAENRMHSASEAQVHAYQKDFIVPIVDAIYDLIGHGKFNKEKYDDLVDYMMAKHGLERNRVFAERDAQAAAKKGADYDEELQKNQQRDYAGLTALTGESDVATAEAMAQKMVDDYEANHDTTALWEKINRATKQSLYTLYSSGMMTNERYEQIRDMFDYYIPLQGFDSTVAEDVYAYLGSDGTLGYGTPIRTAKGRRSKADDPIATIVMNGEAAIRSANRNEMKKNFLNFVQNHPSDLVSVSEVWLKYNDVTGQWEQVTADLQEGDSPADVERKTKAFDEKMEQLSKDDPDHYKKASDMPNVPYRVVQSGNMKQHQVTVKRNGKDYVLTINGNPRAAQALNGLTNPDVFTEGVFGKAMNLGQWLNRQLSAFYTTRNPEFVLSNFLRDAIYSNMMVGTKEDGKYAMQFHKNFGKMNPVSMGKLFASWENGSLRDKVRNGTCTETERMFYDFMMNGGETGWTNMRDIEKHKKEIQSALKMEGSTNRKAWKALGSAFDLMNRSVENCARFAAFVTSREMGRSLERSIWDAKEISVNFNKKGAGDKFLTANNQNILGQIGAALGGLGRGLYVFWNASVQGLNNIARGAKKSPWKFVGRIVATNYLLGALMPILNEILTGGDDDDENSYYNLPEYIRRSNICFRFGKDMPWITIPLPIEFRAIYGLGELSTGVLTGKERYTNEEFAKQFVSQLSQVLPLDFMEGGGGWHAFVPSQLKPFVEAQGNKSWTGLPIYKDTPFNQNDPEWTKAYKSANKQLVEATKWLNDLTNGSDYAADEKKGWIDINPAKLEYMLKGYFGGYSTMLDRFVKTAETVFGERDFEWRNIPMASRVLKEGDERTANRKLTNEYFDLIHEYDETKSIEKKKREKAESGDYIAKADYVAYTNFNENYKKAQVIDNFKPLLDALKDEKKNQSEYSVVEIEERENELRREMVDLIHSIQDAKKGQMPDIETPVDHMLDREVDRHGYTSKAAASRIASRMGGTDGYGHPDKDDKKGQVYYNLRDHYDLRQDVAMQVAIKQAKDAGDDDRARDLDLARDSYNENKKAFENGAKEAEQGLQWLRKDREQALEEYKVPFDKRPEKGVLNQ